MLQFLHLTSAVGISFVINDFHCHFQYFIMDGAIAYSNLSDERLKLPWNLHFKWHFELNYDLTKFLPFFHSVSNVHARAVYTYFMIGQIIWMIKISMSKTLWFHCKIYCVLALPLAAAAAANSLTELLWKPFLQPTNLPYMPYQFVWVSEWMNECVCGGPTINDLTIQNVLLTKKVFFHSLCCVSCWALGPIFFSILSFRKKNAGYKITTDINVQTFCLDLVTQTK